MKKKVLYSIITAIVVLFSAYGVLVNWRPHATEGLFKFDCCSWAVDKYGNVEDKPKKKVKE